MDRTAWRRETRRRPISGFGPRHLGSDQFPRRLHRLFFRTYPGPFGGGCVATLIYQPINGRTFLFKWYGPKKLTNNW